MPEGNVMSNLFYVSTWALMQQCSILGFNLLTFYIFLLVLDSSLWRVCLTDPFTSEIWNCSAGYQLKTVCAQILFPAIFGGEWNSGCTCTQRFVQRAKRVVQFLFLYPPIVFEPNKHVGFCRTFCAKITPGSYSGKYLASKLHSYASLVSRSMKI